MRNAGLDESQAGRLLVLWPQDGKRSVFIPIPKKAMPKNVQPTTQLHLSHTQKSNAQNSPSDASTVPEPRTTRCSSWI